MREYNIIKSALIRKSSYIPFSASAAARVPKTSQTDTTWIVWDV